MPVVTSIPSLTSEMLAVSLPRYAQIVGYSEAAFFGVRKSGQDIYACRTIWTHWQRMDIQRTLLAAQSEVEHVVRYPLSPQWFVDEQHTYQKVLVLDKCNVTQLGTKVVADVSLGEACDHTNDPVTISIAGVGFTDPAEVHVYHPGTDYEIIPSACTIVGGNLNISLPRVRMVKTALQENPPDGWNYTDTGNFEATVDVKRIYADTTQQMTLVGYDCSNNILAEATHDTTGLIRSHELGIVDINRCGCWPANICETSPKFIRVNYQAGLSSLTPHGEDVVIRFAHSLMPEAPCGCDFLRGVWGRDRNVPMVLTAERENCPFGMTDGAWSAYQFAQSMVIHRVRTM